MEEKYILGFLHIKVMCTECEGLCWAQPMSKLAREHYRCHTCTEPREPGVGKPLDQMQDMQFD
jgi:hypothetical protein